MPHKYKIRYNLIIENKPEGYSKDEACDKGLTDALIVISIVLPEDGSYSQALFSTNKDNKQLTEEDLFKAWMTLGLSLSDDNQLTGWHKQIVDIMASSIRQNFKAMKASMNETLQ